MMLRIRVVGMRCLLNWVICQLVLRLYIRMGNFSTIVMRDKKEQYLIILSCALLPLLSFAMFFTSFEREDGDE